MLPVSPGDNLLPVLTAIEKAIGYRPHPTTATRWTRKGVRGVKLATVMVGGRPRTTEAAVITFVEAQTASAGASSPGASSTEAGNVSHADALRCDVSHNDA